MHHGKTRCGKGLGRRFAALCLIVHCVVFASFSLGAKTVYVNCQLPDYAGHDGSAPNLAYKTIQEAVDAAASGDTVEVAPGIYRDGVARADHAWGPARVHLDKKLYLHAPHGASSTIIEGVISSESASGIGSGAIRCVSVESGAEESIIEGFTLRNGRTGAANGMVAGSGAAANGGAVFASASGSDALKAGPFFVGCVIEKCSAPVTAVTFGGVFVRCRVENNESLSGQCFSRWSTFANCLFTHNYSHAPGGYTYKYGTGLMDQVKVVNCTFANNFIRFYPTQPSYYYNNLYSSTLVEQGGAAGGAWIGHFADMDATRVLMGTATGDLRLRAGQTAANVGDAQYLGADYLALPSGEAPWRIDPYIDYYGTQIPQSGTIAAGAAQTTATPVAGAVVLDSDNLSFRAGIPGCKGAYVFPTNYPVNYRVQFTGPTNEYRRVVLYTYWFGSTPYRMFPLADDSADIIAPPNADDVLRVVLTRSTVSVKYADPAADGAIADGTFAHPYTNLQQAVNAAVAGDAINGGVVIAKRGAYDTGYTNFTYQSKTGLVRFLVPPNTTCRITSEDGAEDTILTGAPDPQTGTFGEKSVGAFANLGVAQLQGFTVTGAYSPNGSDLYSPGRGTIFAYGTTLHVDDCILTNNVGAYAAIGNGRYDRCIIRDNVGGLRVFAEDCILASCQIDGNSVTDGNGLVVGGNSKVFGCSLYANEAKSFSFATTARINTLVDSDLFADPASFDFRIPLAVADLAVGVGPSATDASDWHLYATSDLRGVPIRFDEDGSFLAGAYTEGMDGVFISAAEGGLSVSGGRLGFNALSDTTEISISAAACARPVSGLLVGGVTNDFETLEGHVFTVTKAVGNVRIEPVYGTAWQAAPNGRDAALGGYPAEALTIQGALTKAAASDVKTVRALPGTYDAGQMIQSGDFTLHSRVVVPPGVTLESAEGRAATVIKGLAAATEDEKYSYAPDGAGLGVDALRCVYLSANARIRGFTLMDGYTRERLADGKENHGHADTCGGGVYAPNDANCFVEDCLVTNCAAFRGGGVFAFSGQVVDSVLAGNTACYISAASEGASLYGCLVYGSRCFYPHRPDQYGSTFVRVADRSTFLDPLAIGTRAESVRNSLFYSSFFERESSAIITNCVFLRSGIIAANSPYYKDETWFAAATGVVVADADELAYGDDLRPLIGRNVAIDRGFVAATHVSAVDALGGQRVYNGAPDVGALEADWRDIYAKDIRKRRVSVSAASADVVESADGTVTLKPDARIEMRITSPGGRPCAYALVVRLADGETVPPEVRHGDVTLVPSVSGLMCSYALTTVSESDALTVAHMGGHGIVEIVGLEGKNGFMLILR